MEITGRIAVKQNKNRAKKVWLTIGMVAFAITLILEVSMGNIAFLALTIPFLYLNNVRRKLGSNIAYKDVIILVEKDEREKKIEISNCEYRDKVLCSVRFTFQNSEEVAVSYIEQKEEISIQGIATKVLFIDNTTTPVFEEKQCEIMLFGSLDAAKRIAEKLQCEVNLAS